MIRRYDLEIIIKRIYKNRIMYLFFLVEIALGMTILFFSLNHLLEYKKTADQIDSQLKPYETRLEITGENNIDDNAINLDDYNYINNRISNKFETYLISNQLFEKNGEVRRCDIIFFDFKKILGTKNYSRLSKNNDTAKFILDLNDVIDVSDMKIYSDEYSISLNNNNIEYNGKKYEYINKGNIKIRDLYIHEYESTDEENEKAENIPRIYADISLLENKVKFSPVGIRLFLNEKKLTNPEKIKDNLTSYLKNRHPLYEYAFKNDLGHFSVNNRSDLIYMCVYLFISVVIIMLFLITFTGMFKILMKKREKDLAVSLAFGSNRLRLILSILIENYSVIFLGTIIGILCGIKINSHLTTDLFKKGVSIELVIFLVILSIIISFISSIGSIIRLSNMEVVDIINEQ